MDTFGGIKREVPNLLDQEEFPWILGGKKTLGVLNPGEVNSFRI